MIDPAITLVSLWTLAVVFAFGVSHKLRSPLTFVATLASYRLLPTAALPLAAGVLTAGELCLVFALLRTWPSPAVAASAALAVLALYTAAIGVNLVRGRRDIDCGCSGAALRQTLSGALLARNALLMLLALLAVAPGTGRTLQALDLLVVAMAVATAGLLYAASNQLIANAPRLRRMFA